MLESMADKQVATAYIQYNNLLHHKTGSMKGGLSYKEFRKYFFDAGFSLEDLVNRTIKGEFK